MMDSVVWAVCKLDPQTGRYNRIVAMPMPTPEEKQHWVDACSREPDMNPKEGGGFFDSNDCYRHKKDEEAVLQRWLDKP